MIPIKQIRSLVNPANNQFQFSFEMDWDKTTLGHMHDKLDASFEGGAFLNIAGAAAVDFDKESGKLFVEVLIDASDLFEEYPNDED